MIFADRFSEGCLAQPAAKNESEKTTPRTSAKSLFMTAPLARRRWLINVFLYGLVFRVPNSESRFTSHGLRFTGFRVTSPESRILRVTVFLRVFNQKVLRVFDLGLAACVCRCWRGVGCLVLCRKYWLSWQAFRHVPPRDRSLLFCSLEISQPPA